MKIFFLVIREDCESLSPVIGDNRREQKTQTKNQMNKANSKPTARDFTAILPSLEVELGRKLPLLMQKAPYNNGNVFSIPSITNGFVDAETAFGMVSSLFHKMNLSRLNK